LASLAPLEGAGVPDRGQSVMIEGGSAGDLNHAMKNELD
jgi:hypothetical protein